LQKNENPQGREYAGVLTDLGDVHRAKGDIPAALIAYQEGLEIAHTLTQQDPRDAEWQQDLAVSRAKMTMVDAENARDIGPRWLKYYPTCSPVAFYCQGMSTNWNTRGTS
jgi:hypothetical protein